MRVFCITSDKYLWAIRPFLYLMDVYWSSLQPVVVCGYSVPSFPLPPNTRFHSVSPHEYPPHRWSDGLIHFLLSMPDEHFVLMLDDYWLCRTVDHAGIETLGEYARNHPNVLKIDLTTDRANTEGAEFYESWGHYDLVYTPKGTVYRMSLQAAIWNKSLMLNLLRTGLNPWQVELQIDPPAEMLVLGTRQPPLRYANAVLKGAIMGYELDRIPEPHRATITPWIPTGWRVEVPNS